MAQRELVPAQGDSNLKIDSSGDKLEDDNWVAWKWHMTRFLRSKNLMDAIEGQVVGIKNDVVLTHIGNALSKKAKELIVAQESAYQAWRILEIVYENKRTFEKQDLLARLHGFRFKSNRTIADDFSELQTIISRLRLLGHNVDDDTQMSIIMRTLLKEFNYLLASFKMLPPATRTLAHLTGNVLSVAREMQNTANADETALVSQRSWQNRNNRDRRFSSSRQQRTGYRPQQARRQSSQNNNRVRVEGNCHFCKKPGHWKNECWKNPMNKDKNKNQNSFHQKAGPPMDNRQDHAPMSLMALDVICPDECIFDSGSSMHMTSNLSWLTDVVELADPISVKIGDGSYSEAAAKGKVVTNVGTMEPVFYVPKLAATFFSANSVINKGIKVVMSGNNLELFKDDRPIATGYI